MKKLLFSLLFMSLPLLAKEHETDHPIVSPPVYVPVPGPRGPIGPPSAIPGPSGRDGKDSTIPGPRGEKVGYTGRISLRLVDTKYYSLGFYDLFDHRHGRNRELGVEVMLKLGRSYEEQRIDELEKLVQSLITRRN
jgi:hypothetical protein